MKPRGLDSVRFPHKRGKERKSQKKKRRKPRTSQSTEEPYYNEPRHNTDPVITKKHLKARQNYSKICGNELRYNEYILTVPTHNFPRCNEYFVRPPAAVSKNDRFDLRFE